MLFGSRSLVRLFGFSCVLFVTVAASAADFSPLLDSLSGEADARSVPDLLWAMSLDDGYASEVMGRVDATHLALTDSLLATLRNTEPELRTHLPLLHVIRDDPPPNAAFVPAWRDVRWQGVRLLRAIVEFAPEARDARLRNEVDALLRRVKKPQTAQVAGIIDVFVIWWADRGDDPQLTHDASRIFDVEPWLERIELSQNDANALQGLDLVIALDADLVLRERLLKRLSPQTHSFLAAELTGVIETSPDSLVALGVPPRRWSRERGKVEGHAPVDLYRIAHEVLDLVTPFATSQDSDMQRRIQRILWWQSARYESRYWRDGRQAPSFARFLEGLDRSIADGGTPVHDWMRAVYLETDLTRTRIFEQLSAEHEPVVSELIGILSLSREEAIARGFRLSYRPRAYASSVSDPRQLLAIDWPRMQGHARLALTAITGERQEDLVLSDSADLLNDAWRDWWTRHGAEPRWYRNGAPEASSSQDRPQFETESGRIK